METTNAPSCHKHHAPKEWRATTFEYEEDGVKVRVPNLGAWVCPVDDEASFTPDTVDELLLTIRDLIEAAKKSRGRRSELTEYVVSVR